MSDGNRTLPIKPSSGIAPPALFSEGLVRKSGFFQHEPMASAAGRTRILVLSLCLGGLGRKPAGSAMTPQRKALSLLVSARRGWKAGNDLPLKGSRWKQSLFPSARVFLTIKKKKNPSVHPVYT